MNKIIFSIIIPCYNYGRFISDAVNSVLSSTFQDFEIIVVNDGSTDPYTLKVLNTLKNPRLKIIHQENKGLPAARNAGIKMSKGRYIVCLDADDLIEATYLEKAFWIFETNKKIGVVSSLLQTFGNESSIWPPEDFLNPLRLLKENAIHSASAFRKVCWEQVGGYTETLKGYEDWEFWIKIIKKGWKIYLIPEILFYYRKHSGSMLLQSNQYHNQLITFIRNKHPDIFTSHKRIELLFQYLPDALRSQKLRSPFVNTLYAHLPYSTAKYVIVGISKTLNLLTKLNSYRRSYFCRKKSPREDLPQIAQYQVNQPSNKAILCIFPWLSVGGADQVNLNILSHLKKYNIEPVIITTEPSNHAWQHRFSEITANIFHLPKLFADQSLYKNFILEIVKNRRINLIFISNSRAGYKLLPAIKTNFKKINIVSLIHMQIPTSDEWSFPRMAQENDPYITLHITTTHRIKRYLENLGINHNKIKVINNGIDIQKFSWENKNYFKLEFHKKFGICNKRPIIGFIGRLSPQKHPLLFIEIFKKIINNWKPSEKLHPLAIIVGDGELYYELKRRIKRSKLDDHIILAGYQSDVRPFLASADLIIQPSLIEGHPLIGLEAMAMGVPIIASKVPGWEDIITNGFDGFLVPLSNKEKFVELALKLLYNNELRRRIALNARMTVTNKYALDKMTSKYLNIFKPYL